MSDLIKRLGTGSALGLGFAVLLVYGSPWLVGCLLVLCSGVLVYEWGVNVCQRSLLLTGFLGLVSMLVLVLCLYWPLGLWLCVGLWCGFVVWLASQRHTIHMPHRLDPWWGAIVIGAWAASSWILWYQHPIYLLSTCLVVIVVDSMAYFVGRAYGQRKIVQAISPNKTEYGMLGGMLSGALLIMFLGYHVLPMASLVLLALILPFFSVVGDLWESACKRRYQVKDSGDFLPGHGGLLDRLDGLLAVAPLSAVFFLWYVGTSSGVHLVGHG